MPLGTQGSGHDMFITRGPSVVRLHRKSNSSMQVGLFHCEILDARGMDQSIFIGIYPNLQGEGNNYYNEGIDMN